MPTETFEQYSSRYLNDPANANSSVTTIDRLAQEGENNFAVDYPCILKRVALSVVSGTSTYTLSDDVISIRRITWKGFKLDPLPHRNAREVFQNMTQQGRPFWYIFNNIGQNNIQFFPCVNESIASVSTNLYSFEIPNRVIVEYFQAPDFVNAIIPSYFRRRLLKAYVLRGCFNIEGQGQNLKNSKYFKERWRVLKQMYGELLGDLHNKPRKLIVNGISSSYYFPGHPILPIDRFGTSVDAGE
jgi:hypothetical protein